jgi:hypothetical protein
MIQAMYNQRFETMERPPIRATEGSGDDFAKLFGNVAEPSTPIKGLPAPSTDSDSGAGDASTIPAAQTLGDPDVQGWLTSYYAEQLAADPTAGASGLSANTSYEPAPGAGSNFAAGSVYGPDAIFTQALANQDGNAFASMTGDNAAEFTSQLPGIPTQQAQQQFDQRLAIENAGRLESGQPIDTTAYWSDPGSITAGGTTYTAQQLGYAGAAQSSGPQPIYISSANQVGANTFSVPGYAGTVTGIEPGRYYTLQQLEKAGLQSGQPDAEYYPGSWTAPVSA